MQNQQQAPSTAAAVTIVPSGPRVSDWCFLGSIESDPPTVRTFSEWVRERVGEWQREWERVWEREKETEREAMTDTATDRKRERGRQRERESKQLRKIGRNR